MVELYNELIIFGNTTGPLTPTWLEATEAADDDAADP